MTINGQAVRALVEALPSHVFDDLIAQCGAELFDGLTASEVEQFIHWEETNTDHTEDDVARDYGYDDMNDMIASGPFVVGFSDGLLIIE